MEKLTWRCSAPTRYAATESATCDEGGQPGDQVDIGWMPSVNAAVTMAARRGSEPVEMIARLINTYTWTMAPVAICLRARRPLLNASRRL